MSKYIKILEDELSFKLLNIENEKSYALGCICEGSIVTPQSYINQFGYLESTMEELNKIIRSYKSAILFYIYVEEQKRGLHIGKSLLKNFITKLKENSCKYLIIICENSETKKQFNLENWYKSFGFKSLSSVEEYLNPIMVLDLEEIKEVF